MIDDRKGFQKGGGRGIIQRHLNKDSRCTLGERSSSIIHYLKVDMLLMSEEKDADKLFKKGSERN